MSQLQLNRDPETSVSTFIQKMILWWRWSIKKISSMLRNHLRGFSKGWLMYPEISNFISKGINPTKPHFRTRRAASSGQESSKFFSCFRRLWSNFGLWKVFSNQIPIIPTSRSNCTDMFFLMFWIVNIFIVMMWYVIVVIGRSYYSVW